LEFLEQKSILPIVIPAEAGIQSFANEPKSSLDAALRRHDNSFFRLTPALSNSKGQGISNIPETEINFTEE